MENSNESRQLTLDNALFEGSPQAVDLIKESIEKRDSTIKTLTDQITKMNTREYNINGVSKKYDSLDTLYNDMNAIYSGMGTKLVDMETRYKDMESKYMDLCNKYKDIEEKLSESEKKDSANLAEIEKINGEKLVLQTELDKRLDSAEIETRVKERVELLSQVQKVFNLDSKELLELSSHQIKLKAIESVNENFPMEKRDDSNFIDGAYAMSLSVTKPDFNKEKSKIEHIVKQDSAKLIIDRKKAETELLKQKTELLRGVR